MTDGKGVRASRSPVGPLLRSAGALPIRTRLVAGFVVAVSVVLAAAGAFVYARVQYALDRRLNSDLRAEAAALGPLVRNGMLVDDPGLARTPAGRRYQVLSASGQVLMFGSDLGPVPALSPRQAQRAASGPLQVDTGRVLPISRRPLRLLAIPLPTSGPHAVLVVGERRDARDEALRELLAQLVLAGLGALLVTAVVGDRLAAAALGPVEQYRARAAGVALGANDLRLDVPPGRDDEVTRLGHTLNDMLDALAQALDTERRFTQEASHELRTPLTLLSTRVQLALRRPRTVLEHEQVLRELDQDLRALTALAEQLLQITTAREAQRGDQTGCDLAVTAAAYLRSLPAEDPVRGARPDVGVDARRPLLVGLSAPQVQRVLDNLLGNARTHGGGVASVRVTAADGAAVLTVQDLGPGVPGDFLPRAADRFARTDVARAAAGAGLGLSLVRELVDAAGGELRLCSRGGHHRFMRRVDLPCTHPAVGTTATALLPLRQS